jgi:two-component system, cell cycle response regulator DivK
MAKILVIDDDAFNLKLALTVLQRAGHEVHPANGGEAGVAAALTQMPDLVLMDIQMPDMDGISALRCLRADPRSMSLTVVALTALAMKGDAERLLAEGFDGYLVKPFRREAFLAAVDEALRCRRPATSDGEA